MTVACNVAKNPLNECETLPTSSTLAMPMRRVRSASPDATSAMRSCRVPSGARVLRRTITMAADTAPTKAKATREIARMICQVRSRISVRRSATMESMSST